MHGSGVKSNTVKFIVRELLCEPDVDEHVIYVLNGLLVILYRSTRMLVTRPRSRLSRAVKLRKKDETPFGI